MRYQIQGTFSRKLNPMARNRWNSISCSSRSLTGMIIYAGNGLLTRRRIGWLVGWICHVLVIESPCLRTCVICLIGMLPLQALTNSSLRSSRKANLCISQITVCHLSTNYSSNPIPLSHRLLHIRLILSEVLYSSEKIALLVVWKVMVAFLKIKSLLFLCCIWKRFLIKRLFQWQWVLAIVIFGSKSRQTCWRFWLHFEIEVLHGTFDEFQWSVIKTIISVFLLYSTSQSYGCQEVQYFIHFFNFPLTNFHVGSMLLLQCFNFLITTADCPLFLCLLPYAQSHFHFATLFPTFLQPKIRNKSIFSIHSFRTHSLLGFYCLKFCSLILLHPQFHSCYLCNR